MIKEKYLTREDYLFKIYLNKLQNFSEIEVKANQLTSLEMMSSISNFDFSKLSSNFIIEKSTNPNFIINLFIYLAIFL